MVLTTRNLWTLSAVDRKKTLLFSVLIFVVLLVSLLGAFYFKNKWLWMDEVLSYLLVSDPSIAHMNSAVVGGMDANPPLFVNIYWLIGHFISLDTQFLRAVSVIIFALAIAVFYYYLTTQLGTPTQNFILVTVIVGLTYLNFALATQIRTYAFFLLIGCCYFIILHLLTTAPDRPRWLAIQLLLGLCLVFTHNFGLFYLAASGAFFGLLWLWSKQRTYLWVLATHAMILLIWLVSWYSSFAIQAEAGKPHSWIPLPTFLSFFITSGELAPNLSSTLERSRYFFWLPILRFGLIAGLFAYISLTKIRAGFRVVGTDKVFLLYLLSGFIYLATIFMALIVSWLHTSIFLSRYLWPGHLLLICQLVYAYYYFVGNRRLSLPGVGWVLPVYVLMLTAFITYQSRKLSVFSGDILPYLNQLDARYPVFVETADYFLPLWFHKLAPNVRYLLDWQTAATPGNYLNATVEHKILKSVRENYHINAIVPGEQFTKANFPHFYVVDEDSQYQIEHFIRDHRVKVVRVVPVAIAGHRILECTF